MPYYSEAEYDIKTTPVNFTEVIPGISFAARNCRSLNNREGLVRTLQKYIQVDSVSSCLNNAPWPADIKRSDKSGMMRKYLFHLSAENENSDDYITEKVWGALSSGSLPVYLGAPNVNLYVPEHSVVSAADFASFEELGEHLLYLTKNRTAYMEYHAWRFKPFSERFERTFAFTRTHSESAIISLYYVATHILLLIVGMVFLTTAQIEASSTSSRCVEGFYFHDGWCLGLGNRNKKKSYAHQFRQDKTFCEEKFKHGRQVKAATITNNAQVTALKKVLKGEDLKWAFIGWAPFENYKDGPVDKLEAADPDIRRKPKKLKSMLGVKKFEIDCSPGSDHYFTEDEGNYATVDTYARISGRSNWHYYGENEYYTPTYSSNRDSYGSYGSSYGCTENSELIMTQSLKVTLMAQGLHQADEYTSSYPVCMYEVPERESSVSCPHLLGNGFCRFAKPTDQRKKDYSGDSSNREDISEEECYEKCRSFKYCKAYEFYGESVDKGMCEMHFDVPVNVKTTSNHKVTRCVALKEESACTDEVSHSTPKPTPTPTPKPTSATPTSKPTPEPTPETTRDISADQDARTSAPTPELESTPQPTPDSEQTNITDSDDLVFTESNCVDHGVEQDRTQAGAIMARLALAFIATATLAALFFDAEASKSSDECVQGFYFHDGWCIGLADDDEDRTFIDQFETNRNYCWRSFKHAPRIDRAVITNEAQAKAMEKALKGTGQDWAFIGWTPRDAYSSGKVGKVKAPSLRVTKDADQLDNLLGRSIGWRSCTGDTYSYGYGSGNYNSEFDDDSYSSKRGDYTTNFDAYYADGDYSTKYEEYFSDYTTTYGNSEYTSSYDECAPLIMKRSGKIIATLRNRPNYIKTQQLCMYEVHKRNEALSCPNLIGEGYCRFAKPTNIGNRDYSGDWTIYRDISEETCYEKCLDSTYCKAYEFYGNKVSKGTCELHYDKPISWKKTNKKVAKCVQMVKSSACTDKVPFSTPSPTKAPTPYPTPPTPAPTEALIVATESDYPACPNNMILTQCFKPACEKRCGGSYLNDKCPENAERAFIVLPAPQKTYTYEEEAAFLQTYYWSDKCQNKNDNVIVELPAFGPWVVLETNDDKKYDNNADLCWIIRAPAGRRVNFKIRKGGKTQANKDVLEVWDVTSPAEATFDALTQGQVDTILRETFDGKIKKTQTLDAEAEQMVVHFYSDHRKTVKGFDFWVRAT
ncbi:Alpha-1,3-fucosyltransferase 10 [Hondaea fermentalgiana]|uniref:Fucosyltransferase n=1 Tax=Hondaea fermentalgiana TaxID=2315210 RepID=A0A2R5GQ72_9STRA|nr:Alpha-1,3-fucosyltransferase 10 [Hondaea fermentalgiana]|eukprot:GBG30773.1 Alpha-1,3-fucosyltransferase 10 [Hondaea fermentalgiana]